DPEKKLRMKIGNTGITALWKLRTQEQPVTLGRRGPKSNQSPSEEEDPGAASHPRRKRTEEHPDTIVT
ncbi:hypothetical protein STEG23_001145, partial [Scotinomys teguina]